ncbi:NAD(P)-binding protein [Marasmius fiardii PR-910]|nr:NAD(P)-binding protein [Marasmius fiardii PR-910]
MSLVNIARTTVRGGLVNFRNAAPLRYVLQRSLSATHSLRVIKEQSVSPLAPIGVAAAYDAKDNPSSKPKPKIFDEFALTDRVGIVSGGNQGIGLEMALAFCEAGARAIYCFDLPQTPSEDWKTTKEFVERLGNGSRLEYVSVDVTKQEAVWKKGEEVGNKEKRMDVCVAAAGILKPPNDCLEYPSSQFQQVMSVNANGVLFTAQAAGRQMRRFGNRGSIIMIASMSGTITNRDHKWVSYNSSKSAVLQMARSMACELGKENIRVNTVSPGHIYTKMTAGYLASQPGLLEKWSDLNPMGRIGRADEMRGVAIWLASDASSFCTGSDIFVNAGYHSW